jgi:hypothetical protein
MRFGIREEDLLGISLNDPGITDDMIRLVPIVLHDTDDRDDEPPFRENPLRNTVLEERPIHRENIRQCPLRMGESPSENLSESSQIIPRVLFAQTKFPIRIFLRDTILDHRHDTDLETKLIRKENDCL